MQDLKFHMAAEAPEPVGPFSHAVEVDGWVSVTGQMPTIPGQPDAALAKGVEAQTRQVMSNLLAVLNSLGLGFDRVVGMRIYLTHFDRDYAAMNSVYKSYFPADRLPSRTCIGVTGLACGALVEIDLMAYRLPS